MRPRRRSFRYKIIHIDGLSKHETVICYASSVKMAGSIAHHLNHKTRGRLNPGLHTYKQTEERYNATPTTFEHA